MPKANYYGFIYKMCFQAVFHFLDAAEKHLLLESSVFSGHSP